MLRIKITKKVQDFLNSLHPKHARQIREKINLLRVNPIPQDTKKLKGNDYKRIDVGEYRIIYKVEDTALLIFLIGKRNDNDIYKKLKRLHHSPL